MNKQTKTMYKVMKIFQRYRERRQEKQRLRDLSNRLRNMKTLERLMATGMLAWNQQRTQLFIAEPLAVVMMKDADSWLGFMHNVTEHAVLEQQQRAWTEYFQREELKAVREALQENPHLSRFDIDRIKRARSEEITQDDMQPPRVQEFDFFIVRDTRDAEGQVIAVGHYQADTEKVELATWDEVRRLMEQAKSNQPNT